MKAKVVVTSGATREPIDSVRFISNLSSGRTGATICEALVARGFHVTQVAGVDSAQAQGVARRETFTDHASLDTALRRLARDSACTAIVHAAAVGDFAVAEPRPDAKMQSCSPLRLPVTGGRCLSPSSVATGRPRCAKRNWSRTRVFALSN